MDLFTSEVFGTCKKSITSHEDTVLHVGETTEEVKVIIDNIKKSLLEKNTQPVVLKLEKRLARLAAKIAIVKVGANSSIELKEKADRIEDAICATKAAIKEGIVSGGGIALLNASHSIDAFGEGEWILLDAIRAPFKTILENAGIDASVEVISKQGYGLNVITGETVNMVEAGIIDPLLVTKSALKNAVSVATTILSTNCVINNLRA
jgi:chaperonin GroEL